MIEVGTPSAASFETFENPSYFKKNRDRETVHDVFQKHHPDPFLCSSCFALYIDIESVENGSTDIGSFAGFKDQDVGTR